jgi:hypothetical protein
MAIKCCSLVVVLELTATTHAQTNLATFDPSSNPRNFATGATLRPPAVSEINGKVNYSGGSMNSAEGHNFDGSITFPISHQFGFQADALYSRIGEQDFYGGAGHLFWRNPDVGLIGLTGGYLTRKGVDTFQTGVEGEYYLDRFTFGCFAGVGSISYDSPVPFIDTDPTRFVGRISANYYVLDDLRVGASYVTAFHDNLVKLEAEYQTPIRGVALTAEVARGNHDYDHWLVGLRYYFGGNKKLNARQRQDDPPSLMPQILHGLGLYGAEYNRKGNAYVVANPGSGNPDGSFGTYGFQWDVSIGGGFTIIKLPPPPPSP